MKNHIIIFIAIFSANVFTIQAQSLEISQEVKENIKFRVDNDVSTGIVVGVVTPEGTNYFSYGVKSLKTNEAVDENSVFEIGSISKTFTGLLLADMVEKGELKLDDPLQSLLPEGVTAPTKNGESIKLYQLSNHTSSLPRMPSNITMENPANPYADYSAKQMFEFLNNYELTRAIGSELEYSNYAVGLLGYLLAEKRKMTYEELLIDVISQPLNLENTRIQFTTQMKENLAKGHNGGIEVENWDLPTLAGAGGIRSTAVDMIKYISANLNLEKSSLSSAIQLTHQNVDNELGGLGWFIMEKEEDTIIWHGGLTGGYATFSGFIKDKNIAVVVLSNSVANIDDIGMHILDSTSELITPKLYATVEVADSTLEEYVGDYELTPDFILSITKNGNQLNAQATGQGRNPIFPESDKKFFFKIVDARIEFNRNKKGEVESVTLFQAGQEIIGKKLKDSK